MNKFGELRSFVDEFDKLSKEEFYDIPIFAESLLANNACLLVDGNWVNPYTDKWEGWSRNWEK